VTRTTLSDVYVYIYIILRNRDDYKHVLLRVRAGDLLVKEHTVKSMYNVVFEFNFSPDDRNK